MRDFLGKISLIFGWISVGWYSAVLCMTPNLTASEVRLWFLPALATIILLAWLTFRKKKEEKSDEVAMG